MTQRIYWIFAQVKAVVECLELWLSEYIRLIRSPVFQSIPFVFWRQLFLISVTVLVCCQEAGQSNDKAVVSTRACEDFVLSCPHELSASFWRKGSRDSVGFYFCFLFSDKMVGAGEKHTVSVFKRIHIRKHSRHNVSGNELMLWKTLIVIFYIIRS